MEKMPDVIIGESFNNMSSFLRMPLVDKNMATE
jgi:hypothetical protein